MNVEKARKTGDGSVSNLSSRFPSCRSEVRKPMVRGVNDDAIVPFRSRIDPESIPVINEVRETLRFSRARPYHFTSFWYVLHFIHRVFLTVVSTLFLDTRSLFHYPTDPFFSSFSRSFPTRRVLRGSEVL